MNAFNLGNPLEGIADEGSIFIQSPETDPQRVWDHIPAYGQKLIRNKRLKVFYLDTVKIAKEIATDPDLQQRMQGVCLVGIFIRVTPFASRSGMSDEHVLESVEKYIRKYFGKRGEHVVQENLKCVREGLKSVMEVPWNIISAPAKPKAQAQEEVVFAK